MVVLVSCSAGSSKSAILAVDDYAPSSVDGKLGEFAILNAFDNDSFDLKVLDLSKVVVKLVKVAVPTSGTKVPVLDTSTGTVNVPAGTIDGVFQIEYSICEKASPTNCDSAKINISTHNNPYVSPTDTLLGVAPSTVGADLAAANKNMVLDYLDLQYGSAILSGQQNLTWDQKVDMMARVFSVVNKYPAIQGFDFLDDVNSSGQYANSNNQVELAKQWWLDAKNQGKNGIVAFAWHWRDPTKKTNSFYSRDDSSEMIIPLDKNGNFDFNSKLGLQMKRDIDFVGRELLKLQEAGVPVLWRPLHEGAGDPTHSSPAWFWWGEDGSASYKALYRYMYNYYVNLLGLKNLIWIWNGQGSISNNFYPGDDVTDIAAWDTYNGGDRNGLQSDRKTILNTIAANKLTALSEVGGIPDPSKFTAGQIPWSFFIVWNDSTTSGSNWVNDDFWSGSYWNPDSFKKDVYDSELVISLDELPVLNSAPAP